MHPIDLLPIFLLTLMFVLVSQNLRRLRQYISAQLGAIALLLAPPTNKEENNGKDA